MDDKEADCVAEPVSESSRPSKKKRSSKPRVTNLDGDDDDDDLPPTAEIFLPRNVVFSKVISKDDTIETVRALVAGVRIADLHALIKDIAERVAEDELDPKTQFINCESLENCAAYWKVYLGYTQHLFGRATTRLSTSNLDTINNLNNFKIFHERLSQYLDVEPPQPAPAKRKILIRDGSADSGPESSPVRLSGGKKLKKSKLKKTKSIKPITKSAEQKSQEAELKRIADRERNLKKEGKYKSTTHDGSILVNPGKEEGDMDVCLHPELAAALKGHQVEGVRFMWKQVNSIHGQLTLDCHDHQGMGLSTGSHHGPGQNASNHRLSNNTIPGIRGR
jgi:hypothetical protein